MQTAKSMICWLGICASSAAWGVDSQYKMGVEIDPVVTGLSVMDGVRAFGLGAELALGEHVVVAGVHRRITSEWDDAREVSTETTQVRRGSGVSTTAGLRIYSNRRDDSFYFGVSATRADLAVDAWLGGAESEIQASYFAPGSDAGYRWVWESGFVARAGLALHSLTNVNVSVRNGNQQSSWSDADIDALIQEIPGWETSRAPFVPSIDLGIGWVL